MRSCQGYPNGILEYGLPNQIADIEVETKAVFESQCGMKAV
ncbi:MAG: hypothetical protein ACUVRS_02010 [Armatimonadota bacterium]